MSAKDSVGRTLGVAVVLCLVCSVVVSTAAVMLKPRQVENQKADIQRVIAEVAGLDSAHVEAAFQRIDTRVVELGSDAYATDIDPATFDQRKAASDPERNVKLSGDEDIAGIKKRAKHAKVYVVRDGENVERVVLPVHGYGLWSTLYGFISVESDGNTVYDLKFYEHAETPGLGGEVDNPRWRALWEGKVIYDESGDVAIEVVRGQVPANAAGAEHKIDGLSGATLTSKGVSNLVRYWMGEQAFGPYLKRVQEGRA